MNKKPEERIGILLREKGWRVAAAESCTGGLVGHRLTNVPGSSDYYQGSVTAYANAVKMRLLDVDEAILDEHGAVSAQTVTAMARGIRAALSAELGISISGIAGPGGGTEEKPVGLVWIGLSAPDFDEAREHLFEGDRLAVKEQAAEAALQMVIAFLEK